MKSSHPLYYAAIAGAAAGLLAWVLVTALTFNFVQERIWTDLVDKLLLGAFIGGIVSAVREYLSEERFSFGWCVAGTGIGVLAALLAAVIYIPVDSATGASFPLAGCILAWILLASLIGLGLGLRWIGSNPSRMLFGLTGGIAGGAASGVLIGVVGGRLPDVATAFGYMLAGIGIGCGNAVVVTPRRVGTLAFVSSADPRAHHKLSRERKTWQIRERESYLISGRLPTGDEPADQRTIYLKDSSVAERHARVYCRMGRFYLARHPDTSLDANLAQFILRVRGKAVRKTEELAESDEIQVGRTTLRFSIRPD